MRFYIFLVVFTVSLPVSAQELSQYEGRYLSAEKEYEIDIKKCNPNSAVSGQMKELCGFSSGENIGLCAEISKVRANGKHAYMGRPIGCLTPFSSSQRACSNWKLKGGGFSPQFNRSGRVFFDFNSSSKDLLGKGCKRSGEYRECEAGWVFQFCREFSWKRCPASGCPTE